MNIPQMIKVLDLLNKKNAYKEKKRRKEQIKKTVFRNDIIAEIKKFSRRTRR